MKRSKKKFLRKDEKKIGGLGRKMMGRSVNSNQKNF